MIFQIRGYSPAKGVVDYAQAENRQNSPCFVPDRQQQAQDLDPEVLAQDREQDDRQKEANAQDHEQENHGQQVRRKEKPHDEQRQGEAHRKQEVAQPEALDFQVNPEESELQLVSFPARR